MSDDERHLVRASEQAWVEFRHPLNAASTMRARFVSRATGLERLGISIATLPPGGESYVCHSHESEEEFIYVISGRGRLKLRDAVATERATDSEETVDVGPGDFIGFPTPSVAHQLVNPFDEELTYLMGGESRAMEVADFPELGKRAYRHRGGLDVVDLASITALLAGAEEGPADA